MDTFNNREFKNIVTVSYERHNLDLSKPVFIENDEPN